MRYALLILLFLAPGLARAQAEALENPGSVSAIQERKYQMHHELLLGVGVLPDDAFYKGLIGTVGYTYHFTDSFAWQVGRGTYSYNVQTALRTQLERDFDVAPTASAKEDQVQWMVGSDLMWSPLYGKMAFLNQSVLHLEAFLLGGGSVVKVDRDGGFRPAINVGVGLRLFSSNNISFRMDVTNNAMFADTSRINNILTVQLGTAFNFGATE